jgi:hypothetical protein
LRHHRQYPTSALKTLADTPLYVSHLEGELCLAEDQNLRFESPSEQRGNHTRAWMAFRRPRGLLIAARLMLQSGLKGQMDDQTGCDIRGDFALRPIDHLGAEQSVRGSDHSRPHAAVRTAAARRRGNRH